VSLRGGVPHVGLSCLELGYLWWTSSILCSRQELVARVFLWFP
jgi:hypothetical protein